MQKKNRSSCCCSSVTKAVLTLAVSGLLALNGQAAPITYTSVYSADAMPNATAGTNADPLWALAFQNAGNTQGVSGGVYSSNTTNALTNQLNWTVGRNGATDYGTSSAWGVTSILGATVDFRLQVTAATGTQTASGSGGVMVGISDNVSYWTFFFNPTGAIAAGATNVSVNVDNSVFQTYRIVTQNGVASLYVAGTESALISNIAGNSFANLQRLYFGDGSNLYSGAYNLDYIAWNNQLAEFSAPIPEPGAVWLLGGAFTGLAAIRLIRRRSSSLSSKV